MEKGTEVLSISFVNLDFIYYLIYLFFKSIMDFFIPPNDDSLINFFNVWRYTSDGAVVLDADKYSQYGEGVGAIYDGYSLFTPPHGGLDFGGVSGWIDNFFTNPYCLECSSFSDLFFGGLNTWLYIFIVLGFIPLIFLKQKSEFLTEKESVMYDRVYKRDIVEKGSKKNEKWEKVLTLVNSENQNDWKAAIVDAENLLEEALEENSFYGQSVGDRLKKADFDTVQNAWAGHKTRNQISHDINYELTHRDAKVAIANYNKVFNEFYH